MFDPVEHMRNRSAHTLEDLRPYEGRFVAWSLDGKRILAHGGSWEELQAETDRLGLAPEAYVSSGIPAFDEVNLGSGLL